ncbi:hypothetical protein [Methylocaldum szegediense]|nr:hypothetical protein [Methylocaldum szegediense]
MRTLTHDNITYVGNRFPVVDSLRMIGKALAITRCPNVEGRTFNGTPPQRLSIGPISPHVPPFRGMRRVTA